jgi:hypothetical protein
MKTKAEVQQGVQHIRADSVVSCKAVTDTETNLQERFDALTMQLVHLSQTSEATVSLSFRNPQSNLTNILAAENAASRDFLWLELVRWS